MNEGAAQRNAGLDWIRVIGLLLMAGIHFFKGIPATGPLSRGLHFAGEGAAGFFFFAFGMTAARYHAKSLQAKIASSLPFLYVALAHNLYIWHRLDGIDFLFFLLLWRLLLDSVASGFSRPERVAAWLAAAIAASMLVPADTTPLNQIYLAALQGFFAILPWGLFVLAGFLYAHWAPRRGIAFAVGAAAVGASLLCDIAAEPLGRASLALEKWPLRVPYVLFYAGVALCIAEAGQSLGARAVRRPAVFRGLGATIRLLSDHLLLATALHYVGVQLLLWLATRWSLLAPGSGSDGEVSLAILISWSLAIAMLVLGVRLAVATAEHFGSLAAFAALRRPSAFVAVVVLLGVAILNTEPVVRLHFGGVHPGWPQGLALAAMIYFAFEADLGRRRAT